MALVWGAVNRKSGVVVCGRRGVRYEMRMWLGGVGWGRKVGGSEGAVAVESGGG